MNTRVNLKYQCRHCGKQPIRRRQRVGTQLWVWICHRAKCLRAEWAIEDCLKLKESR